MKSFGTQTYEEYGIILDFNLIVEPEIIILKQESIVKIEINKI